MAKRDYYDVLGISKGADQSAIKSAYRKLAMANHPDRNPDDEAAGERFREAAEAYEILKNEQKRAAYDSMGHAAFEQSSGGGNSGGGFGGGGGGGFSDIFDQMFSEFSGRGNSERTRHGADMRYDMTISLEEAYRGVQKDISVTLAGACNDCSGSGAAAGSRPVNCSTCGGMGKVRAQQGFFTIERPCPTCQGAGQTISDPCKKCRGQGRVQRVEELSVTIPAGVDTGTRIRLSGKGEAGLRGTAAGDLYIFISVKKHAIFERDAATIYVQIPVPMTLTALGGSIKVPTLAGMMSNLKIEKGTQNGRRFRMRGKGMPALRGGAPGDQIVEVQVETPTSLSAEQKDLLQKFADAGDTSPQVASFEKNVRRIYDS